MKSQLVDASLLNLNNRHLYNENGQEKDISVFAFYQLHKSPVLLGLFCLQFETNLGKIDMLLKITSLSSLRH